MMSVVGRNFGLELLQQKRNEVPPSFDVQEEEDKDTILYSKGRNSDPGLQFPSTCLKRAHYHFLEKLVGQSPSACSIAGFRTSASDGRNGRTNCPRGQNVVFLSHSQAALLNGAAFDLRRGSGKSILHIYLDE